MRRSEQLRERVQTCNPRLVPRRWPRRPCRSHPALQSAEREVNRKNVRNNKHEVNSNFRMFVQLNSYKLRHNATTLECLHNSITIERLCNSRIIECLHNSTIIECRRNAKYLECLCNSIILECLHNSTIVESLRFACYVKVKISQ